MPAEETPAFGGIAERFRRAGDLDRAIALCRDGLKRFPEQLSARVTLGWSLLDKGQYDAARAELEQVLRKAPDNLAAIRGLAELHDRTEGAMPPEDERSWKSDEVAAETTSPMATEPAVPAPDRRAPIPVSVSSTAAEVLHTAAHAEKQAAEAAAAAFEPAAGLSVTPVELEDAAAASMAAAEPSPFFVVAPAETLAFDPGVDVAAPMPFEVAGVDAVEVELETPGAAALSAADLAATFEAGLGVEGAMLDAGPAVTADADVEAGEIDWAGLASLTEEASVGMAPAWDAPRTESAADGAATLLDLEGAEAAPLTEAAFGAADMLEPADETVTLSHIESEPMAAFAPPEGLDDIDAAAGQELADAIKALEEATKRVEARLAPGPYSNAPATPPAEIAAYDFGPDPGAADELPSLGLLDTRQDGSFELLSPDLADVSFGLDSAAEAGADALSNDWIAESVSAEATAPSFDFAPVPADVVDEANDTAAAVDAALHGGESSMMLEATDGAAVAEPSTAIGDTAAMFTAGVLESGVDVREQDVLSVADVADDRPDTAPLVPRLESEAIAPLALVDLAPELGDVETPAVFETLESTVSDAGLAAEAEQDLSDATDAAFLMADAAATDELAAVALTGAAEAPEVPEAQEVPDMSELSEIAEIPEVAEVDEIADVDDPANIADLWPVGADAVGTVAEPASPEPEVQASVVETESDVRAEIDLAPAVGNDDVEVVDPTGEADDDLALAAMVATEPQEPTTVGRDVVDAVLTAPPSHEAGLGFAAAVALSSAPAAETIALTHVYDSPVLAASAAVAALVDSQDAPAVMPLMGQVNTPVRSPLAALERFLRKVQARQLELRGETVA